MASKVLNDSVTQNKDGTWDFRCPGIVDSRCGDVATGVPFISTGWPTKKVAMARGDYHFREHVTGEVSPSLEDFRAEHGLVVAADGTVTLEDIS